MNHSVVHHHGEEAPCNGAAALSMDEFRAELDVFSGPLDLLLHLIRDEEVDILDIPISRITDSYLSALRALQMFDINIAAEFLVMAATLMDIKSRSLLPDAISDDNEGGPEDELVQQLIEYKRFKQVSARLRTMAERQAMTYPLRPCGVDHDEPPVEVENLLEDIDLWDCVSAYAEVMRQIAATGAQQIIYDDIPISVYMDEIRDDLQRDDGGRDFLSFFHRDRSRPRIIGVFLALLELLRLGEIRMNQEGSDTLVILSQAPS